MCMYNIGISRIFASYLKRDKKGVFDHIFII